MIISRRQSLAIVGGAVGLAGTLLYGPIARRLSPMKTKNLIRVHFAAHVDCGEGIDSRPEAEKAALSWMWSTLVERHIDPLTRRVDTSAMRQEFENQFRKWIVQVETVPTSRASL